MSVSAASCSSGSGALHPAAAPGGVAAELQKRPAHILAIATEHRQESAILQRSAELLGYKFQLCGIGEPWDGWGTKLVQYQRALERDLHSGRMAAEDPVLLIDGWDCILVGPADELRHKVARAPYATEPAVPWVAGERICGPDFFKANRIDAATPDMRTPWRYPNAGAMCGRASDLLRLLADLLRGPPGGEEFPLDGNDQDRLHEHLLEVVEAGGQPPYMVDSRCGVFQCLYEAEPQWQLEDDGKSLLPRMRNTTTGERPLVLHGNGHTGRWFMTQLWREMDFLVRIGLAEQELAHLPHDGPVVPGTVPDEATERNWAATFQLYRIIEQQVVYARQGIEWDPWKEAAAKAAASTVEDAAPVKQGN